MAHGLGYSKNSMLKWNGIKRCPVLGYQRKKASNSQLLTFSQLNID